MAKPVEKCYPSMEKGTRACVGYGLLIAGIVLLFVCIPVWAWLAMLGVGLMALGVLLLKLCNAWR